MSRVLFAVVVGILALTSLPAARQATSVAPQGSRGWLFFIDDLHIAFRSTGLLRNLTRALASGLIEGDEAYAAQSPGPSSLSIELTSDRGRLESVLGRISGASLNVRDRADPRAADEIAYRFSVSIGAAERMLPTAAAPEPGRWHMLFLSDGYDLSGSQERIDAFVRAARRAGVFVFTINTQALADRSASPSADLAAAKRYENATRATLQAIASGTGGVALLERQDVAAAVQRIRSATGRSSIRD